MNSCKAKLNVRILFLVGITSSLVSNLSFAQKKPTEVNDQKLILTGIVKDKSTGETLPFSTIKIKGTTTGTTTNADGFFTLSNIPSDTSTLIVQYIGYATTSIKLSPNVSRKDLVIELQSTSTSLDEVVIRSSPDEIQLMDKENVSTVRMTPKKLEQLPNIGERDILRSFQLLPGISSSNESSSGLYVRGGTPDQNLVMYDGFTVYHVDHLYGFYSAFNSNALKDVQLYKGGFESRFGGRISSVTEITGKDGNQNHFNAGLDLNMLSMNAFVEVPIGKKFSSIIAFRRSYKGPIYNSIFGNFNQNSSSTDEPAKADEGGKSSNSSTVASYFYDLNGKFTFRPTQRDVLSLSIFNGTDHLDNSSDFSDSDTGTSGTTLSSTTTDLTNYGNVGTSLKWSRRWTDKLYGTSLLSYSNYYSDRNNSQGKSLTDSLGNVSSSSQGIFENNDLKDYSIKSDFQYALSNGTELQFGGFGTFYNIDYTYAQNDTVTILDKADDAFLAGAYVQTRVPFFDNKLKIIPGIRFSYFTNTSKVYIEPRLSATYALTDRVTLKASTGKYYQFANRVLREDILSGSRDFWLLSDGTSIPVSSSIHYILGTSYETQDYLFSVEGYYKKLSDVTEYSLRFNTNPFGTDYDENFFTGNGNSKGVELLVQRKSGKLNGWVSYTLGQAQNRFDIYSDAYYPASQDVTHEFKAVLMYKLGKRWDISSTWVFATGRPYTAPSGAYSVPLLDGSTQNFYTVTAKNSQRLPNYHRMDLAVNYKLFGGKDKHEIGYIGLSVFNLYNRTNVWYKQYSITNNEILETDVNYLGITPNLTVSLKIR